MAEVGDSAGEAGAPEQPPEAPPAAEREVAPAPDPPPAAPAAPIPHQPPSYLLFAIVALLAAAADLLSKEWATGKLTGPQRALASDEDFDDARVTQAAYVRMLDIAKELPLEVLQEIVELSNFVDWDAGWAFEQALQARAKEGIKSKSTTSASVPKPRFDSAKKDFSPIEKNEDPTPLDPEEAASVLEYGGPFAQYFESYEHRPEQVDMLKAVTNALSNGNHLLVEAGTGVGKSFAYLVPAAMFAVQNNTRVVVSTNTINLQDQLIKKDIPDLQAALNLDVRAAVLKGRSNYLCPAT